MMSDEYIRKERVIEEINNLREHIPDSNYGLWQDGYACGLSDAYSAISNIKAPHVWKPIKDELPKDNTSVLICTRSGRVVTAFYDRYYKFFRLTEDDSLCYVPVAITHWMYAPEAPEVDTDA